MFYLLNFENHSFISCNFPEEVTRELTRLTAQGADLSKVEIVNASEEDMRMSVDEFNNTWGKES